MLFSLSIDTFYKKLRITNNDDQPKEIIFDSGPSKYWGIKIKSGKLDDGVYEIGEDPLQIACEDIADLLDKLSPSGRKNGILFGVLGDHFQSEHDSVLACLVHFKEILIGLKENTPPIRKSIDSQEMKTSKTQSPIIQKNRTTSSLTTTTPIAEITPLRRNSFLATSTVLASDSNSASSDSEKLNTSSNVPGYRSDI